MTDQAPEPDDPSPSLAERVNEGRQTFQLALWSRLIALGVVAFYALLFVVVNTRHVRVDFVLGSTRASLIWVILLCLATGLVLGVLLSQLYRHRMRRR